MKLEIEKFLEKDNIFIVNNMATFVVTAQDFFDFFKKELTYFKIIEINKKDSLLSIEYVKALVVFYKLSKKLIENKCSLHQLINNNNNLSIAFELYEIEKINNNIDFLLAISNNSGIEIKKRLLINNSISFDSTNDFDIIFNQNAILDPRELLRLLVKENKNKTNYFFLTSLDQIIEDALKLKYSYYLEMSYLKKIFIEEIKKLKTKKFLLTSARQQYNYINRLSFSFLFMGISFQYIPSITNFNTFIIILLSIVMIASIQLSLRNSENKEVKYYTMPRSLVFVTLSSYVVLVTVLTYKYDYIFKPYEAFLVLTSLVIYYSIRMIKFKNSEIPQSQVPISVFLLVTLMALFYKSIILFASFFILINLLLMLHRRGKV